MDLIINDSTPAEIHSPHECGRGLDLSGRPRGYAYGGIAEPFPDALLIPESEWQARIEERKAKKRTRRDQIEAAKLPAKNQARLNYCWVFSPVHCVEILRLMQNQPMISLSPVSVGGPLTGFRNVGGYGPDALKFIAEHGVCPSSAWPDQALDPRYYTPENKALAEKERVTEWWELEPGNLQQLISCLLRENTGPVSGGYDWWSHQVTLTDVDWRDGEPVIVIRNQWQGWGNDNFAVLQGPRMMPADAVCPRVATAA